MGGRALAIADDNRRRRPIGGELRSREPISAYGHGSPVLRSDSTDCLQARARFQGLSRLCAVYTVACVNNIVQQQSAAARATAAAVTAP